MRAQILITKETGQVVAGEIALEGVNLVFRAVFGYEILMAEFLQEAAAAPDPVEWFLSLPRKFTGSYLRVGHIGEYPYE